MTVWIELAIAENFLIDGVLLFLALRCARVPVKVWRLLLASAIGAAEAVVFPILPLPVWAAYLVKGSGGVLLCLVAVHSKSVKRHLIAIFAFFALTFALGGALVAVYSFMGTEYAEGAGYLVEQVPAGLLFGAGGGFLILIGCAVRSFFRFRRTESNLLDCRLSAAGREVSWRGYADSGNLLTFRGKPVCVISAAACIALFGRGAAQSGTILMNTAAGRREAPVFECDRMTIRAGGKTLEKSGVYLAVGEVGKTALILSCALLEA